MSQVPRGQPGPPRGARARPGRPTRATYWRRRVMVLAVGIGLITALVWGVNGLLSASRSPAQAALAGHTTTAGPARAHRHSNRSRPAASPSPRPSPVRSRHRKPDPTRPAGPVLACAPGAVALTLSSPQYWYQPGATPQFTVRARTGGQPCRFRVSGTSVAVVVTAGGHHIWSSADCAGGSGSRTVVLTGSRSAVLLRVSWNRRTSAPGCAGAGRLVPPGEYQVSAVAGHLHSSTVHMVLGAPGASGP
jgi:hypothetical protein